MRDLSLLKISTKKSRKNAECEGDQLRRRGCTGSHTGLGIHQLGFENPVSEPACGTDYGHPLRRFRAVFLDVVALWSVPCHLDRCADRRMGAFDRLGRHRHCHRRSTLFARLERNWGVAHDGFGGDLADHHVDLGATAARCPHHRHLYFWMRAGRFRRCIDRASVAPKPR